VRRVSYSRGPQAQALPRVAALPNRAGVKVCRSAFARITRRICLPSRARWLQLLLRWSPIPRPRFAAHAWRCRLLSAIAAFFPQRCYWLPVSASLRPPPRCMTSRSSLVQGFPRGCRSPRRDLRRAARYPIAEDRERPTDHRSLHACNPCRTEAPHPPRSAREGTVIADVRGTSVARCRTRCPLRARGPRADWY